jgi:hypothetical protein
MEEFTKITDKYQPALIEAAFSSLENLKSFTFVFIKDVAEIYDCLTRLKNIERNPSGFSIDDAPILGLLVRIAKLMKEIVLYYERDNAEVIGIIERPILEAGTIATFLMKSSPNVIEDYRKCSYKDRLRILRDLETGSPFFDTKPGQRLLKSVREKMTVENLSQNDFDQQKKNKWRVQGKSFFQIFSEVHDEGLYASSYGMMSESIHGSWNESLDWCLKREPDGTYKANLSSYPADVRFLVPVVHYTNEAFRLWSQRVDVYDENTRELLDWIERVTKASFRAFDSMFDE